MKKSALKQYAETSARFVVAHASPRDSSAPSPHFSVCLSNIQGLTNEN